MVFVLMICYVHFTRNVAVGALSADGMDMVQAARRIAEGHGFSTNIVRPLLLRRVSPNRDGSLPDTAHAPLYPTLAGMGMKLTGKQGPGQGDRPAVLVSLFFFLASVAACYLLGRRLFGPSGALLACVVYALGANALTLAVQPRSVTLATTLFTLLLLGLFHLDVMATPKRAGLVQAAFAGVVYGLLFLALYSSLILLLPILIYLVLVSKRDARVVLGFLVAALVVTSPFLFRNVRATGNPVFNARLLELTMHTETFPGYSLYRSAGMPQTVGEYLAGGGVAEIARKMGNNLLGYYSQIPYAFGILLLPLFLVAALTRFTSGPVNRIRYLVYVLLLIHVVGISLVLPYSEGLPILLMYVPFASVIGTTFFLNFIRARNLPPVYTRASVTAWMVMACVPGVAQIFAVPKPEPMNFQIYGYLYENVPQIREAGKVVFVSEVPWEIAYRLGVPAVWLPNDAGDFRDMERLMGRSIAGIVMTPALEVLYAGDAEVAPWRATYIRLTSLLITASYLEPDLQQTVLRRSRISYPQEIGDVLAGFAPRPVPEANNTRYSLYWQNRAPAQGN